jgi:hypothetical protein
MREESKASDRGETPRTREGGRGYSNNRMSYSIINVGQIGMHLDLTYLIPVGVVDTPMGADNLLGCMSVCGAAMLTRVAGSWIFGSVG